MESYSAASPVCREDRFCFCSICGIPCVWEKPRSPEKPLGFWLAVSPARVGKTIPGMRLISRCKGSRFSDRCLA